MTNSRAVLFVVLLSACQGDVEGRVPRGAPPAAAMVVQGPEQAALESQLRQLEAELDRVLDGEPERLLPAEALTDRLLQARRPVDWLATGYDVESRLRQLQAMADRVVAMLRRGMPFAQVGPDIASMRRAVRDLRAALARGGGPAPPPLDSLLARAYQRTPIRGMPSVGSAPAPAPAQPAATPEPTAVLGRPVGGAGQDSLPR